jgi:hypothetical protein
MLLLQVSVSLSLFATRSPFPASWHFPSLCARADSGGEDFSKQRARVSVIAACRVLQESVEMLIEML